MTLPAVMTLLHPKGTTTRVGLTCLAVPCAICWTGPVGSATLPPPETVWRGPLLATTEPEREAQPKAPGPIGSPALTEAAESPDGVPGAPPHTPGLARDASESLLMMVLLLAARPLLPLLGDGGGTTDGSLDLLLLPLL